MAAKPIGGNPATNTMPWMPQQPYANQFGTTMPYGSPAPGTYLQTSGVAGPYGAPPAAAPMPTVPGTGM